MKTPSVADVISILADIAPPSLAESWDNCGLQAGDARWPADIIRIALDPTPDVVEKACQQQAGLLITHHPLIFRALKKIDFATFPGNVIQRAARHEMAVYSAHTNLDSVHEGVNDVLFDKIGLSHRSVLVPAEHRPTEGLGRLGEMNEGFELKSFTRYLKDQLDVPFVRVIGKDDLPVKKVAVCSGSGSGLLAAFFKSDADVFVTGDIRYHDARDAETLNRGLIDIGHFASEYIILDVLREKMAKALSAAGFDSDVAVCRVEKDPFTAVY